MENAKHEVRKHGFSTCVVSIDSHELVERSKSPKEYQRCQLTLKTHYCFLTFDACWGKLKGYGAVGCRRFERRVIWELREIMLWEI